MTNSNPTLGRITCSREAIAANRRRVGFSVIDGKADEVMQALRDNGVVLEPNPNDSPVDFYAAAGLVAAATDGHHIFKDTGNWSAYVRA